ncbi:MAG: nucleotidyltransferase family protein [Eubacteriales bacterium]|nr:nucleotidyltransferase family protein [Eubacteriales bacterium]
MRNLVVVDEGFQQTEYYRKLFESAKAVSGAEQITVIISGAFLRNGFPASVDKYVRAQKLLDAGASYVVEMPSYALLLGDNQYAFAVMSMLHKLPNADGVLLPYRAEDEDTFEKVRKFLFAEPFPYQAQLRKRKLQGEDPEKIYPSVAEQFVPGAESCLGTEQNRFAVELANTLIRSYSTVQRVWLNLQNTELSAEALPEVRDFDRQLEEEFRKCVDEKPAMQRISWMKDIFMGSDQLVERLAGLLYEGAEDFFVRAVYKGKDEKAIRRYVWGCLAGYRRIDNSISILYGFVPYVRLLAAKTDAITDRVSEEQFSYVQKAVEEFVSGAKAEVLIDLPQYKEYSALTDESKLLLERCDARLEEIRKKEGMNGK